MDSVKTLMDVALLSCKTKRELAHRMGISEQTLQALYTSRRHLTARQAIGLANIVNRDPRDVLAQCAIEREDDLQEKGRLTEAFFPRGIPGVVAFCIAVATICAPMGTKADTLPSLARLSLYTLCALRRLARFLNRGGLLPRLDAAAVPEHFQCSLSVPRG